MRWLVVLAVLTGCPAPQAPVAEPPPPPPEVVAIDATPAPIVPAVLAVRGGRDLLQVIRVDGAGDVRVLHDLRRASALPRVADLAVDAASGRYALLVEADSIDDGPLTTPRDVMTLVLGSIDGGLVAAGPADVKCVMHKCFESEVALEPGGGRVLTLLHRSNASEVAQYTFGATPKPTHLTAKGVERPALSPDRARMAYLHRSEVLVADVGGSSPTTVATAAKDVVALALGDHALAYRTGRGAVTIVDVDTHAVAKADPVAADPRPALRVAGAEVFTTDAGNVVAASLDGGAWRVIAAGALVDVSADGAWVLVDDGALSVVDAADGHVAATHDVPAAFGEVRARLSP